MAANESNEHVFERTDNVESEPEAVEPPFLADHMRMLKAKNLEPAQDVAEPHNNDTNGPSEELICDVKRLHNLTLDDHSTTEKWQTLTSAVDDLNVFGQPYIMLHRLRTDSIQVQSQRLKTFLDKVLAGYPDWNPVGTPYTLFPPFKPLVHRWDKILQASSQLKNKAAKEAELFCHEIGPIIAPHLSTLEQIRANGVVQFQALWLILSPGDLVVTRYEENLCVFKLQTIRLVKAGFLEDPFWRLSLQGTDWNGTYGGPVDITVKIDNFSRLKSVTELEAYPLEFDKDREEIREQLLARGRKYAALRGYHVKTCIGRKYIAEGTSERASPISGRVIIDAYAFYRCQKIVAPSLGRNSPEERVRRGPRRTLQGQRQRSYNQTPTEGMRKEELHALDDTECLIAVPRVRGFDLKDKEWCAFNVDDVQDADWSDTPYDKLVLQEGEKELIMALVNNALPKIGRFEDFVRDKGEGTIILLCGPPGVGKTLTAEAVADKSKVPLYVLTAGDLGTSPSKVESALDSAFECCRLWDAVLLLDEADIFLETRQSNSLAQNELVSIFLRRLEYYKGLLFMTTNRIDVIDDAFKSRIDLILPYYRLDKTARRTVLANFMSVQAAEVSGVSDSDWDELAEADLNGREIKSLIKTGQILAAKEGGSLTMKHLRLVLNIRKRYYNAQPG